MLGLLVVWSPGSEPHIGAGQEPPSERSLPGTHRFGEADQSGGLLDAREGSSQIIQVPQVLHSGEPSAGSTPRPPSWGHCWCSPLGKAFKAR